MEPGEHGLVEHAVGGGGGGGGTPPVVGGQGSQPQSGGGTGTAPPTAADLGIDPKSGAYIEYQPGQGQVQITYPDGTTTVIDLQDDNKPQTINVDKSGINGFTLEVLASFGPTGAPVVISEIEVFAKE